MHIEMSLSPIKQEILESMFLSDKPQKAMEIAKELHREFQPVMMHLLGLTRMGYVTSPEKGLYILTIQGKGALGISEINKEKAAAILSYAPHDKAFNFYKSVGNPLNVHAHNLRDFTVKIDRVDIASLEFHLKRGDFESWFKSLGDEELAKKMELLKRRELTGEDLRKRLHAVVDPRFRTLTKFSGQVFPENQTHSHSEHTHTNNL